MKRISKKKLQVRLDELDASMYPGNPLVIADHLKKSAKGMGIRVLFGLVIKKRTYDATLFLPEKTVHLSLGDKKQLKDTYKIRYEDDVAETLNRIVADSI